MSWLIGLPLGLCRQVQALQSSETSRRQLFKDAGAFTIISYSLSADPAKSIAADQTGSLARRLTDDILQQQAPTVPADNLYGADNFFYPSYMAGTWDVTQTLVKTSTPLGVIFLGGPNADGSIAQKTNAESMSKLNIPVKLQLRFIPTKFGVAEDRLFNTKQRLDSFAGRSVVSGVTYANVGASNRNKVIALGGTENDPLQTVFIRYKGPAAQKTFVTSHKDEVESDTTWTGTESQRSIFALTNENTAPPITTDTETIWQLRQLDDNTIRGRLRIASYLNAQQDKLYFEARNRAVSLLDYSLDMKRIDE